MSERASRTTEREIPTRDLDRLETVAWGEENFGSLTTNRAFPRRTMLRLVKRGLVRSVGPVLLCDDDGFTAEPEREREGFVLTDAGRAAVERYRASWFADAKEAAHV
ncbi:MAG TPA: hypothetical protein VFI96_05150 [Longimicrobiaceae bacterium]|nr:hypothetical protein [Longimicrobiaceae bacterium]